MNLHLQAESASIGHGEACRDTRRRDGDGDGRVGDGGGDGAGGEGGVPDREELALRPVVGLGTEGKSLDLEKNLRSTLFLVWKQRESR